MLLLTLPAFALPMRYPEGALQGSPALTDLSGRPLASGRMKQSVKNGQLSIEVDYELLDGRHVQERAELLVGGQLQQLNWSWEETRGGTLLRHFDVDFRTGRAFGLKAGPKPEQWSEQIEIKPGETFAGVGFSFAIKNLHARLEAGESVGLTAVAFTPSPRIASVTIRKERTESIRVQGRAVLADRTAIHPEIPWVARPFVHAPDQHLWFSHAEPPDLLRVEGNFIEPGDPILRIEPFGLASGQARTPPPR
jgi:hypothetical protein